MIGYPPNSSPPNAFGLQQLFNYLQSPSSGSSLPGGPSSVSTPPAAPISSTPAGSGGSKGGSVQGSPSGSSGPLQSMCGHGVPPNMGAAGNGAAINPGAGGLAGGSAGVPGMAAAAGGF